MHRRLTRLLAVGHDDRPSKRRSVEAQFHCLLDLRCGHAGRHLRGHRREQVEGLENLRDHHPITRLHEAAVAGHGLVKRIGGAGFVDDLLPVILDRFGTDAGQDVSLEAGELGVGHDLEHAVARLDGVAHDPSARFVELVAVLADEGHEDRVERATADEPAAVVLAAIERTDEPRSILLVDPHDRRQLDVSPLPHGHRLTAPLTALEEPREDVGRTPRGRTVAAQHAPAEFVERRRDPGP